MLHESLWRAWSVQKRAVPIIPALYFSPDGLALGASTILLAGGGTSASRESARRGSATTRLAVGNIRRGDFIFGARQHRAQRKASATATMLSPPSIWHMQRCRGLSIPTKQRAGCSSPTRSSSPAPVRLAYCRRSAWAARMSRQSLNTTTSSNRVCRPATASSAAAGPRFFHSSAI